MKLESPKNANYAATVVAISAIVNLENCNNIQAAIIFGNSVIVSKDVKVGDVGLFFPLETKLSREFLSANNLFRDSLKNADQAKKGFFEDNARIRCVKFRGNKSEGFYVPLTSLEYIDQGMPGNLQVGDCFDKIELHEICEKYIPRDNRVGGPQNARDKKAVRITRLVENQFRLHIDTEQLRKNVQKIHPDDYISITNKLHGTSWVVGNVLCKRKLSLIDKVARFLGIKVREHEYDIIYASRNVVKNRFFTDTLVNPLGYYGEDLWGSIAKRVKDCIPQGFTLYGEAVGYLESGRMIQAGYHYGAAKGTFDSYVYRITQTNEEGKVTELSWPQTEEFCRHFGLKCVPCFYYGQAKYLFPISIGLDIDEKWHDKFLSEIQKRFITDSMCPMNNEEVPEEGIVVRVDGLFNVLPLKLKNYRFLEKETKDLDSEVVDIETEQSIATDEQV